MEGRELCGVTCASGPGTGRQSVQQSIAVWLAAPNWVSVTLKPVASWIGCVYDSAAANVLLLCGL